MSAVAPIEIGNSEVWSRLESSPQWANLTGPQRVWVTQYIATGSTLHATQIAYKSKSPANARILSYELAKNPRILATLDIAAGRITAPSTEREGLIKIVRKQLKAAEPGGVAASRLAAQLERLVLGIKPGPREYVDYENEGAGETVSLPDASDSPVSKVGDIVLVDGAKFRVTAVNAQGKATDGEPL